MAIIKRFFSWITWQRVAIDRFKIVQPKREAVIAAAYSLFYIAAAGLISLVILSRPLPIVGSADFITDAWYAFVLKIGLLLILPAVWFLRQGYRFADLLPEWRLGFKTALAIAIAFVLGLGVNAGILPSIIKATSGFSTGELLLRSGLGLILPLFIAALPEEFVYRGFLQTRLERVLGRIPAILLTALLFMAWHLPSRFLLAHGVEGTAGNLASVLEGTGIPVFIVGLLFNLFWDRYRSLPPLIAVHWGIDILPIVASLLGIRY